MADPRAKIFTKDDILRAMRMTKSNRAAARYLGCSLPHYRKYAKLYVDEQTGQTLYETHMNPSGKGIPKFLSNKGKMPDLKEIIEGRVSIDNFTPQKIRDRLVNEGYLEEKCHRCDFSERRVLDYKMPLILHFKDNNKRNYQLDNVELLCYNCYFLWVGNVFTQRQVLSLEDHIKTGQDKVDWEFDDSHIEHLKELGLWDDEEKRPGDEFIHRL